MFRGLNSLSNQARLSLRCTMSESPLMRVSPIHQLTDRLKEGGIVGSGFENILSGVKNFLPARKDSVVTRIVDAFMEPSSASHDTLQNTDDYLLFDPRQSRSSSLGGKGSSAASKRMQFSEAIVFVVGGGSYVEYSALQEHAARSASAQAAQQGGYSVGTAGGRKRITYGSDALLTPKAFLGVLQRLQQPAA